MKWAKPLPTGWCTDGGLVDACNTSVPVPADDPPRRRPIQCGFHAKMYIIVLTNSERLRYSWTCGITAAKASSETAGSATLGIFRQNCGKQRKNSERTAGGSLFFRRRDRRQPRISAENGTSAADNLWKNSKKQREAPCLAERLPVCAISSANIHRYMDRHIILESTFTGSAYENAMTPAPPSWLDARPIGSL